MFWNLYYIDAYLQVFSLADIRELISEYHNRYGVIVMLMQPKGKFF